MGWWPQARVMQRWRCATCAGRERPDFEMPPSVGSQAVILGVAGLDLKGDALWSRPEAPALAGRSRLSVDIRIADRTCRRRWWRASR